MTSGKGGGTAADSSLDLQGLRGSEALPRESLIGGARQQHSALSGLRGPSDWCIVHHRFTAQAGPQAIDSCAHPGPLARGSRQ